MARWQDHKVTTTSIRAFICFASILSWSLLVLSASAQGSVRLFVSDPDLTQFPTIQFNVRTAGFESVPLANLDGLSVRENGIPISGITLTNIPAGIDAVFVLDSNDTAQYIDIEGDVNRYEKMKGSINRFGNRFMNPNSLDTISVIVPDEDGENGRFLINSATTVEQITTGLETDTPTFPLTTPLNEMMEQAIAHLETGQTSNRFQAILLMSDAGRLSDLLNIPGLVDKAQAANVAIFVAIVGNGASFDEIENAAALYQPTNGFYVPLPNSGDTDPIYLIWQRQSNQVQVQYDSLTRDNGRYPITLNLGQANASTTFELALEAPIISLALENDVIRRAGTAVDTPLTNLVPAVQPVAVAVIWPDGIPRQFETVTLYANNQAAPLLDEPTVVDNQLKIRWDISTVDAGAYEIYVEVQDSLGKTAVSDPRLLTILTEWPDPPTPTPAPTPTATPPPTLTENIQREVNFSGWFGGGLTIGLGLLILPLLLKRRRAKQSSPNLSAKQSTPAPVDPFPDVLVRQHTAVLDPISPNAQRLILSTNNVTIGRLPTSSSLQISDRSISPLHARIRWQNGRYWLYDEGSDTGTYLNEERLGLRPLAITENDTIRLGSLLFRFTLLSTDFLDSEEE